MFSIHQAIVKCLSISEHNNLNYCIFIDLLCCLHILCNWFRMADWDPRLTTFTVRMTVWLERTRTWVSDWERLKESLRMLLG